MKLSRLLMYVLLVVIFVIWAGTWVTSRQSNDVILIDTTDQPTIGDPQAKVHVVVFEEPKCKDCRHYNNAVFPLLKQEFIDTGKIIYTVVPVSFLPYSMPGALALLCVYNQDPGYPNADLFMQFLDHLLRNSWTTMDDILRIAEQTSHSIDILKLRNCVNQATYTSQIESNLLLGKELQEDRFSVPSVYVNGRRVLDPNYDTIKAAINANL
jgi:protein-disulfide isomerase